MLQFTWVSAPSCPICQVLVLVPDAGDWAVVVAAIVVDANSSSPTVISSIRCTRKRSSTFVLSPFWGFGSRNWWTLQKRRFSKHQGRRFLLITHSYSRVLVHRKWRTSFLSLDYRLGRERENWIWFRFASDSNRWDLHDRDTMFVTRQVFSMDRATRPHCLESPSLKFA